MDARELINILKVAERLKDATRHCYTSGGRHESVAEHSWRAALMAYLIKDEFPEADMERVIKMCLIHDLGEAFTGDIPTFLKSVEDEQLEDKLLQSWVQSLNPALSSEMLDLYSEMNAHETLEAKIFKVIDNLEAVIQHNESDIATWMPSEYQLNLTYANDKVTFSEYFTALREEIRKDTLAKIEESERKEEPARLLTSTLNTRAIIPNSLRFVRSDAPSKLTPDEIQLLRDNNVTTVFDLRDEDERQKAPCPLEHTDGFDYHYAPVTGGGSVPKTPDDVPLSYILMADEKMVRTIRSMLTAKTNVLYFCYAGKDRTGVVSAILLRLLGFSDAYIIEDYLASADNLIESRREVLLKHPELDINVLTPQRKYIASFLAWLSSQEKFINLIN